MGLLSDWKVYKKRNYEESHTAYLHQEANKENFKKDVEKFSKELCAELNERGKEKFVFSPLDTQGRWGFNLYSKNEDLHIRLEIDKKIIGFWGKPLPVYNIHLFMGEKVYGKREDFRVTKNETYTKQEFNDMKAIIRKRILDNFKIK